MSGSNSSAPGSAAPPEPLSFAVHSLPDPQATVQRRVGRWKMLLVMAMCAAPVVGSYFTFYVLKPRGSANYELVTPADMPADLPLTDTQGRTVMPKSLHGQWLLAVAQPADCGEACERQLYVQRQLREMLGKERGRVDKLWLVPGDAVPSAKLLEAISQKGAEVTVLRVPKDRLEAWLKPAPGKALADHFFLIDPMGNWMERAPADPEPKKLKADLDKLLRASASWDEAGR